MIEVLALLLGGLGFMWSMKSRVEAMGDELSQLKLEISKLADILMKIALQDQRISGIEKMVDELRHGIGWIVKPPI